MKLVIFKDTGVRVPRKKLNALTDMVAEEETDPGSSRQVNLVFTTNQKIRHLNHDFRKKDKATDVLSFNIDDATDKDGTFGEIYISVETAGKQAKLWRVSLNDELIRLTCHGLLHLLGYDHENKKDEKIMKPREDYYLERLLEI